MREVALNIWRVMAENRGFDLDIWKWIAVAAIGWGTLQATVTFLQDQSAKSDLSISRIEERLRNVESRLAVAEDRLPSRNKDGSLTWR